MHHFTFVSKASHRHAYASVVDIMIMAAAAETDSNLFMIFPFKMECYDNAMTKNPNQEAASHRPIQDEISVAFIFGLGL